MKMALTSQKTLTSLGVAIGLLIVGFLGEMSWTIVATIFACYCVLTVAIPSKYVPHIVTFGVLLLAGEIGATILTSLFDSISYMKWTVLAWLTVSVAVSVLWPFPIPKKA